MQNDFFYEATNEAIALLLGLNVARTSQAQLDELREDMNESAMKLARLVKDLNAIDRPMAVRQASHASTPRV